MAEALYSKYRPLVFNDVVGQKHILQTFNNAIESNKISHAYMFCGPRGTGKTTMARLLAKACICQNAQDSKQPSTKFCGKCENCADIAAGNHPDVYELDAASRTGVENVREEIISRVGFAPTRGSKKIYIVDEVHMLSTAAFNALLKTLEEPPQHVIFILCTTDPQKVPETILSRCQRFDFRAISTNDIVERLKYVCQKEQVEANEDALCMIAEDAQGAMRNALTALELAIAYSQGHITKEAITQSLTNNSQIDFVALLEAVALKDLPYVFEFSDKVCQNGVDFTALSNQLIQTVRDMYVKISGADATCNLNEAFEALLAQYTPETLHRFMIVLSELTNELKTSANARLSFELAMAKMCQPKSSSSIEALAQRVSVLEKNGIVSKPAESDALSVKANQPQQAQIKDLPVVEPMQDKAMPVQSLQDKAIPEPSVQNEIKEDQSVQNDVIAEQSIPPEKKPVLNTQFYDADVDQTIQDTKKPVVDLPDITTPGLRIPKKPEAVNFSETRNKIKHEAGRDVEEQETDLSKQDVFQNIWRSVFTSIRKDQPGFAATIITANASFDEDGQKLVLTFPTSAGLALNLLNKPEYRKIIKDKFLEVSGKDIDFVVEVEDDVNKKDDFNPEFVNDFRKEKEEPETDKDTVSSSYGSASTYDAPSTSYSSYSEEKTTSAGYTSPTSRTDIKDMLSSLGAINITEEE